MPGFVHKGISILVVYLLTLLAWVYFRSGSMGRGSFTIANDILSSIVSFEGFAWNDVVNKFQVIKGVLLITILLVVEMTNVTFHWNLAQLTKPALRIALFAGLIWLIALFGTFSANSFIYFQF